MNDGKGKTTDIGRYERTIKPFTLHKERILKTQDCARLGSTHTKTQDHSSSEQRNYITILPVWYINQFIICTCQHKRNLYLGYYFKADQLARLANPIQNFSGKATEY